MDLLYDSGSSLMSTIGILILGGIIGTLGILYSNISSLFMSKVVVTMEVRDDHLTYGWIENWLTSQKILSKDSNISMETESENQPESNMILPNIKESPGSGTHYFIYKNRYFFMRKEYGEPVFRGSSYRRTETVSKKLLISTSKKNSSILREIMREAREMEIESLKSVINIYVPKEYGTLWAVGTKKPKRNMNSIILDGSLKEDLIEDVRNFIESREWYSQRGIPYRRGYLLHGPPGCGKTSILSALAGLFGLNLCTLGDIGSMEGDSFIQLMGTLPPRCALLMEDIDCLFKPKARISLSTLLNCIDGAGSPEGNIVFFTSNHPNKLPKSLIRPGRVDKTYKFDLAKTLQIKNMFEMFFPNAPNKMAIKFSESVPSGTVSPAAIQGHLMKFKDDCAMAISDVPNFLQSYADLLEENQKEKTTQEESNTNNEEGEELILEEDVE